LLRIFFTRDDIARTRVLAGPDPMWEVSLSLHLLQSRQAEPTYGRWRRRVLHELRGSPLRPQVRMLFALNPHRGYTPDFLTPQAGGQGLDAGLDALRSTAAEVLRHDLAILDEEQQGAPPGAAALARGEIDALTQLSGAIRSYFDLALAPHWTRIEAVVEGDRARRLRASADAGTEGLLKACARSCAGAAASWPSTTPSIRSCTWTVEASCWCRPTSAGGIR
jgi:hypothetical protein